MICMGTNVFQGLYKVWKEKLSRVTCFWDLRVRFFASAKWPFWLFCLFSFVIGSEALNQPLRVILEAFPWLPAQWPSRVNVFCTLNQLCLQVLRVFWARNELFKAILLCCRGSHIGKNAVLLQNSWLSDFGRFPVTSSSMTVKSKCVLHTKPVVLASIESVLSEKWAFQGHFAVLQRLSHRQKRCFAA